MCSYKEDIWFIFRILTSLALCGLTLWLIWKGHLVLTSLMIISGEGLRWLRDMLWDRKHCKTEDKEI